MFRARRLPPAGACVSGGPEEQALAQQVEGENQRDPQPGEEPDFRGDRPGAEDALQRRPVEDGPGKGDLDGDPQQEQAVFQQAVPDLCALPLRSALPLP